MGSTPAAGRPQTSGPKLTSTPGRVPELDSLRAVAAFAVVSHHFLPDTGFLGRVPEIGWIGVDLFFVLSGYFITTILLEARGKPHYYSRFYLRRALRILPLYYLVVGGTLLYAKLAASGAAYKTLVTEWGSPLWFWFYGGNIRAAILNTWPTIFSLGPLWSVHVEEQFYILYPLVLALVPLRHLRKALVGAIVAALVLRIGLVWAVPGFWKLPYALMPCRMDNLAMGALIADYARTSQWPLRSNTTLRLAAFGAALILVLVYFVGPTPAPPLMTTFGFTIIGLTCMMIVAWVILNAGKPSTKALRRRPLCVVGTISYGIYLLHGPVHFAFKSALARMGYSGFDKTYPSALFYAAATVVIAAVSFHWMEEPILQSRTHLERWIYNRTPPQEGRASVR